MDKYEWEKGQFFQMCLTNLRDDYMLNRNTQIPADVQALFEAWRDLTDGQKRAFKDNALAMIELFIEHLPSDSGNKFLKAYRAKFNDNPELPKPQLANTKELLKQILTELKSV